MEGGTKSAKALFLFLPACFEREMKRWREVEEPFHCGLNLLQSFDVTLGIFRMAFSSLQCFEPRFGYMQRDLFKQGGENAWRGRVQPIGKEVRDKNDSCDVLKQCYSMLSLIYV